MNNLQENVQKKISMNYHEQFPRKKNFQKSDASGNFKIVK